MSAPAASRRNRSLRGSTSIVPRCSWVTLLRTMPNGNADEIVTPVNLASPRRRGVTTTGTSTDSPGPRCRTAARGRDRIRAHAGARRRDGLASVITSANAGMNRFVFVTV